jgi:hypothetical protein
MARLPLTVTSKHNLSKAGVAVLMVSLGAACGSSDGGTVQSDAGGTPDAVGNADGASAGSGDGAAPDGGYALDGGRAADAANEPDVGNVGQVPAVNLGTAGTFVMLAKTGISTVPTSAVTGNLGISPAAASYITGFPLTAAATNVFSTTPQVTGKVYASDYASPTPANLTSAISDMQLAFTDAAGRPANVTELGAGNIGGMTLPAAVYKWGTGLLIPTDVTLAGSATDVWIFEIAQDLTVSNGVHVSLTGGAVAKNVFWEVAGLVDVGTTAHVEGVFMSQTSIGLGTGASITGRLLAQTAVNIESSAVVEPAL